MAIKAILVDNMTKKTKRFPKLMLGDNGSVLFATGQNDMGISGVIVKAESPHSIGDHVGGWSNDYFRDLDGSVTLSNE